MKRWVIVLTTAISFAVAAPSGTADSSQVVKAKAAICHVFKSNCADAIEVSDCETGGSFSIWAGYGKHQYTGLFQLGSSERRIYGKGEGHWWGWWAQVRAAYKYWVASGRDWSPWDPVCRP